MEFLDELLYMLLSKCVLSNVETCKFTVFVQIYEIVCDLGECNNCQYSLLVGIFQDHNDVSNMDLYFGDILCFILCSTIHNLPMYLF